LIEDPPFSALFEALFDASVCFVNSEGKGRRCWQTYTCQVVKPWQVTYKPKSKLEGESVPLFQKGGETRIDNVKEGVVHEFGAGSWTKSLPTLISIF